MRLRHFTLHSEQLPPSNNPLYLTAYSDDALPTLTLHVPTESIRHKTDCVKVVSEQAQQTADSRTRRGKSTTLF